MRCRSRLLFTVCVLLMEGCGKSPEIPGGTPGIVRVNGKGLAEVQVTVYRANKDHEYGLVAIGLTQRRGEFVLRKLDTLEAVWLEPGDYRFTVESIGDIQIPWPLEFRTPEKTPLHQIRTDQDHQKLIELDVPDPTRKSH